MSGVIYFLCLSIDQLSLFLIPIIFLIVHTTNVMRYYRCFIGEGCKNVFVVCNIYYLKYIYTHTHLLSRFVSEETWHIFDFHRIRVQYVSELLSFSSIINE